MEIITLLALIVLGLAIPLLMIASFWKLFTLAGEEGWKSLIPIYNTYIMLNIIGKPTSWLLLMLIPGVNVVIGIIVIIDFLKCYGKDTGFAIGAILLPIVFFPLLAFSSDTRFVGAPNMGLEAHLINQ